MSDRADAVARRERQAAMQEAIDAMSPEDREQFRETLYRIACVIERKATREAAEAATRQAA